jgi:hypothetical protein
MGENARDEAQWLPNALPLSEFHSCRSCECSEPWLERQRSTKLGPHDTIRNFLKFRCLKFPHIVHLDLIYMNYDQKKGWESYWEFDFQPQILWKQRSNEVWLECVIHCWKDVFKNYKIFPLHFQNILDLKKILASELLG